MKEESRHSRWSIYGRWRSKTRKKRKRTLNSPKSLSRSRISVIGPESACANTTHHPSPRCSTSACQRLLQCSSTWRSKAAHMKKETTKLDQLLSRLTNDCMQNFIPLHVSTVAWIFILESVSRWNIRDLNCNSIFLVDSYRRSHHVQGNEKNDNSEEFTCYLQ
jgi:hypothetical protein